jgi:hypothetical protein
MTDFLTRNISLNLRPEKMEMIFETVLKPFILKKCLKFAGLLLELYL